MSALCFVDTETTSLRRDRRAWEIAMIRREADGSREAVRLFVQADQLDLPNADPMSLKIGGFYDRHPDYIGQGPGWREARENCFAEDQVAEIVEGMTRDAHLVANVVSFDADVLTSLLLRHGRLPAWHYHLIDIEPMAVGWLAYQQTTSLTLPWKSEELSRACGVEPPVGAERHTAMGDALWAERWFDKIMWSPSSDHLGTE